MSQPTVLGRKLPHNDFEGDDFTPGAGGRWVTCRDTSIGRAVAFATNGRVDRDGRVYRAALAHSDPDGITAGQAATAVYAVARLRLFRPPRFSRRKVETHLYAARGLVVDGWYDALPPAVRRQVGDAHFTHSMFTSHISRATGNWRVWDALDRNLDGYGRWIPGAAMWDFLESLAITPGFYRVSYVPLQPL